jgi:DNA repair photolyase
MYPIDAPAVYAHEKVMADVTCRARVERVAKALMRPREVVTYTDAALPDLIHDQGLLETRKVMGTLSEVPDPVLLFDTFRFGREEEVAALRVKLKERGLSNGGDPLGFRAFKWEGYNLKGDPHSHDKVCRPCWRVHLQKGCVHQCKYCGLGGLLVSMVNVEEYCEHFGRIIEGHPWQKTFLLDDDADPPGLEPELGCLGPLIEYFGTLKDRYLIIHTKTWNTEWMRDLRHNGNTIIVWSISGPTQSRLIEPKTGTTDERIEAARIAQEAGYQIRYKFKPIIPVRDWRREAAETVEKIFTKTKPDVISLCCFMWMDVDEMKCRLGSVLEELDQDCLRAAEAARGEMESHPRTRPFPMDVRSGVYEHHFNEIRKHDKEIPVSLSTENWEMWARFGKRLGASAHNYMCGCGPQSVPGLQKLCGNAFKAAVRRDVGAGRVVR